MCASKYGSEKLAARAEFPNKNQAEYYLAKIVALVRSQEVMAAVPLTEVQSSRTQRPSAGSSYPYVDLALGDAHAQRLVQLQLEQVRTRRGRGRVAAFVEWLLSHAGPGAVSGGRHAGGEHDVGA